jgi:hypothetical protein
MTRSFGPVVVVNPDTLSVERVHCNWCIFRRWHSQGEACDHMDRRFPKPIPDPGDTPEWCEMKAGAIRDSLDMASGVTQRVWRWSGRRTDEPRQIYAGIPSEAHRQFRLASRDAKRGTVTLIDADGEVIALWPEPEETP